MFYGATGEQAKHTSLLGDSPGSETTAMTCGQLGRQPDGLCHDALPWHQNISTNRKRLLMAHLERVHQQRHPPNTWALIWSKKSQGRDGVLS